MVLICVRSVADRMADVRKVIAGWKAGSDATVAAANGYAAAPVRNRAEVEEFFLRSIETVYGVLPSANTADKREQSTLAWAADLIREIVKYWNAEEAQFGANWWVAANVVTAYLQHATEASRLGINSDTRVYADPTGVGPTPPTAPTPGWT